jgi:hypothetical protein
MGKSYAVDQAALTDRAGPYAVNSSAMLCVFYTQVSSKDRSEHVNIGRLQILCRNTFPWDL